MSAPYIGSRINLISKSDVRYEGILCGIDTNESKVYLQHVRCYGTEDRKKDSPIAPASEVYDVIIFHSTDIKDLSVCELPPVYDPMGFNMHMGQGYPQYGYPMVHPQYGPQYGYYNPYHNYGMFPQNPPMIPHQEMYNSGYPPMSPTDANDKSAQLNLTPPQKINVTTSKVPEKSDFSSNTSTSTSSESTPSENENNSDNTPNEPLRDIPSSSTPTPLPEPKGDYPNPNSLASSEENTPKPSSHSHSKSQNHHQHNNNHHHHHNKRSNNPRNSNSVYLPKGEAKNTSSPSDKHNENVNNNTPSNPSGNSHPVENTESPASDSSAPISYNRNHNSNHNNHSNSNHNQDYRQKRGGNNLNNRGGGYKHYNRRGYDSRNHHSNSNHHSNAMHGNNSSNAPHSSESSQNSPFGKVKEEKEDFDFLSANSKFEKLAISEDLEKGKISPSYNKDDFYDTISCEALDHDESKEKKSYYEQRKIDSETFGDLGRRNNSNNNRGRTRRYNNNNSNNSNSNNRGNRNYHRGNKNSGPSS